MEDDWTPQSWDWTPGAASCTNKWKTIGQLNKIGHPYWMPWFGILRKKKQFEIMDWKGITK